MASPNHNQQQEQANNAQQQQQAAELDAAGHSLAMQRQQQQELVFKLLAQHFHNQFYQLAASSNNNNNINNGSGTQQLSAPTNSSSNARRLRKQPPLPPPPPMPSAYRQQPPGVAAPHYANETPQQHLGASGFGFDLNGMNLVARNQMIHNHILRSQVTTTTTAAAAAAASAHDHPSSLASSGGGPIAARPSAQESLLDFSLRNSLVNPYPLNDMNLFHALGLNLTNNQLVLSLQQQQQQKQQQQSLIHQASGRQFNTNTNNNDELHHPPTSGHHHRQNSNATTQRPINQSIDHDDSNHTDGKELLKFSINTILGKGSPNHHHHNHHHPNCVGFEHSPFRAASAIISNQQLDRKSNSSLHHHHHQHQHLARPNSTSNSDNLKPAHSYIGLIGMCILSSPEKRMVLNDIYQFILDNYPYYRNRGSGWRNSVRHNLSLNECFQKAGRAANGKGHYWTIHPANMEDFMLGDFRRRRAQRKVRRWNHMDVPSDESDDESMEDATKPPLPEHFKRSLEMHRRLELRERDPLSGSISL